jgi:DNA repair protein RadC
VVSIGIVNKSLVHPREVFFPAIKDNAVAIVLVHNHPSGSLSPSKEDDVITSRFCDCASLLGFNVLDHVIISSRGYYSYRREGKLEKSTPFPVYVSNEK